MNAKGRGPTSIGKMIGRTKQTVSDFLKRYNLRGSLRNEHSINKPKSLSPRDVRRLVLLALRNRTATASQLVDWLGVNASPQTIRNELRKQGIRAYRRVKKPKLTELQKQIRLEWAKNHQHWNIQDWRRVLFSDEKKLNLFHSDGTVRVWRRENERMLDSCLEARVKFGGGSVMIWGAISGNGLRILERIEGTLTAIKYTSILENNVLPAFEEFNGDLDWFAEDNDPKHGGPRGAHITRDWFSENTGVPRIDWPPNSPDLNPIENLWNTLQKKVCRIRNRKNSNLFQIADDIWENIPTEDIRLLIDSMPRRISALIEAKGGSTKY